MNSTILQRLDSLLSEGATLLESCPTTGGSLHQVAPASREELYRSWLVSVANLLQGITTPDSYYVKECDRTLGDEDLRYRIPTRVVQRMFGLLQSAKREWSEGLLRKVEYIVAASTFDDFLDHAAKYHKGNKKTEASVLASAVLEDSVKRIAKKNSLNTDGQSIEQLIESLVKASVFTEVKAKRAKAYASVRNFALHAEWDKFDIKDVGEQIKGTRELIEEFL